MSVIKAGLYRGDECGLSRVSPTDLIYKLQSGTKMFHFKLNPSPAEKRFSMSTVAAGQFSGGKPKKSVFHMAWRQTLLKQTIFLTAVVDCSKFVTKIKRQIIL